MIIIVIVKKVHDSFASHFWFTALAHIVHKFVHVHFWFTIHFNNYKFQVRNNFKF